MQLECSFRVNSGQSMTWAKVNGQDITYYSLNDKIQNTAPAEIRDRLTVSGNHADGEYHLVISSTTIRDGGMYECLNYQTANNFRQTLHIIGKYDMYCPNYLIVLFYCRRFNSICILPYFCFQ